MAILHVTDEDFEEKVLKAERPVLVDFWAEWCGPCKQIAPMLDEIATEMEGRIHIAKVDIDQSPESPAKYGVRGIPTLLLFRDGEIISNRVGGGTKTSLVGWIDGAL